MRGVGYDVLRLQSRIEAALGLDRGHRVVLVGVGSSAAPRPVSGFDRRGFTMAGLFDSDPDVVGTRVGDLVVRHVDDLENGAHELGATIGVVATPDEAAQQVCDRLVLAGVRSILSFAPVELDVPDHVEIRRVDLSVEMQVLSFNSTRNGETPRAATADVRPAAGDVRPAGIPRVSTRSSARRTTTGKAGPMGSAATRNGSVIAP